MFSFKKMGLAAAVMLVAGSAMASNFRAADQIYVPIAGHIDSGTVTFQSDVWVSNLSSDVVTVTVLYSAGQGGTVNSSGFSTPDTTSFNLQPFERKEFIDYFSIPKAQGGFGLTTAFGQLVFNGCKASTSCGTDTQDPSTGISPNFRNIAVQSRIYSIPVGSDESATPTPRSNGQLMMGIPWYNYVSPSQAANGLDKVFVTGVRNTGSRPTSGYRTNIGVVNASQFSLATIVMKLYSGTNPTTPIATSQPIGLGPLGVYQNSVASIFGSAASGTNMFVTVEMTGSSATGDAPSACVSSGGCPGFFAYGSSLDNQTDDATTLEGQYSVGLTDIQIGCLYSNGTTPCKGAQAQVHLVRRRQ